MARDCPASSDHPCADARTRTRCVATAAALRATRRHQMISRRSLLLALGIGLAVRLVNIYGMSRFPMAEYQFRAPEADMSLAYEWSGHIVRGDLLGREPVHQYTTWMREIAPPETWDRWWGGAHIFHQAPLYAYTLAAFRLLAGDRFLPIALCQALLGLANVMLIFLLGERLFGSAVAALAALGAALYGPLELHELFLLRDTLGVTVSLLMLWALARCRDVEPRRWLLAGLLLAVATLCREATLLFAPLIAVWVLRRFHADGRALRRAVLWFLVGLGLGLAPLVGRNIAVGAPPLALSQSGIQVFIHGNAPGAAGFGWRVPPETRSILEQANGHLWTTIRLTLASYHGDWRRFLALQTLRVRARARRRRGCRDHARVDQPAAGSGAPSALLPKRVLGQRGALLRTRANRRGLRRAAPGIGEGLRLAGPRRAPTKIHRTPRAAVREPGTYAPPRRRGRSRAGAPGVVLPRRPCTGRADQRGVPRWPESPRRGRAASRARAGARAAITSTRRSAARDIGRVPRRREPPRGVEPGVPTAEPSAYPVGSRRPCLREGASSRNPAPGAGAGL